MQTETETRALAGAARALERLARGAGVESAAGELERVLRRCAPSASDDPEARLARLEAAADEHGLRAQRLHATPREALVRLEHGRPLAAPVAGDDGRWAVLTGRRRGKVRVVLVDGEDERERLLDPARLDDALGLAPGERCAWLAVDPALPCAAAEAGGAPLSPVVRLLRLVRPDRADVVAVVVFAVAIGVLLLATPIAVQALVNFIAFGSAIPPLLVVAALLFLGLVLAGVLIALQSWIVEILQRRIFVRMVADLAARLPRITAETYDRSYAPELVNRFFDILTIQKTGSYLLLDGVGLVLSVLVGLVVLAFYHPLLLAFDIVLLLVITLLVVGPVRRGIRTAVEESKAKYAVEAWLEELARNPLAFKSSGAGKWVLDSSDALARKWLRGRERHFRVVFGQKLGALALQAVASTALLALGGLLVIRGDLSLGQLVASELILTTVVGSLAKTGKHLESFYDLVAASEKVGQLLDLPVERRGGEHREPAPDARGAALAIESLSWRREGGATLFQDLTLALPPGGSLCVSGRSGSGKSTLVELIWGLRRPTGGLIRVDGVDLRDLSLASLRRTVALASRMEVVEGTVRENVRLGRAHVTDGDVRDALRAVGLHDVVGLLPEGLDTMLRPFGRPLSEGELRRLLVARAIAGRPRLLIVEDLLDAMSAESRATVLRALLDPSAPWTLVVVSNLPEVAERCDRHLVLPSGPPVAAATPALEGSA